MNELQLRSVRANVVLIDRERKHNNDGKQWASVHTSKEPRTYKLRTHLLKRLNDEKRLPPVSQGIE